MEYQDHGSVGGCLGNGEVPESENKLMVKISQILAKDGDIRISNNSNRQAPSITPTKNVICISHPLTIVMLCPFSRDTQYQFAGISRIL